MEFSLLVARWCAVFVNVLRMISQGRQGNGPRTKLTFGDGLFNGEGAAGKKQR